MHIDSINKALVNGLGSTYVNQKKSKVESKSKTTATSVLRSKAESIIKQAMEKSDVNPALIEKAKLMLESGQLDNLKNIESAVRKMLKYGV